MTQQEHVVLVNEQGMHTGTMEKYAAHQYITPLHLAFSCWVFNSRGQYLLTRRALSKKAWPGVWTNSVCGHPQWNESNDNAVKRRCLYETGLEVEGITEIHPHFRYCETDADGIMENEICPVFAAITHHNPRVNPQEVMDYRWAELEDVIIAAQHTPWIFSPWMVLVLADSSAVNALRAFRLRTMA